jgi:hypothetical protein
LQKGVTVIKPARDLAEQEVNRAGKSVEKSAVHTDAALGA